MAASSLLLFGPLSPKPSQTHVAQLRKSISEIPDLDFMTGLIKGLPSLWPTIVQACPQLDAIAGLEELEQLHQLLTSGAISTVGPLSNLVAAPLTVISQIREVLSQDRDEEGTCFPGLDNVQGFCLGFLTAAALASSRDTTDFRHYASVAVRLAICIGATVDLDEASHDSSAGSSSIVVRWKTDTGKDGLTEVLKDHPQVSLESSAHLCHPRTSTCSSIYATPWSATDGPISLWPRFSFQSAFHRGRIDLQVLIDA